MHFAIPVLLSAALAAAADTNYVVHERRTPEQAALLRRLDRVSPDTVLPIRIALKQQHDLTNVSNASSPGSNKHLAGPGQSSPSASPPTQQQQIVLDWLKQQGPGTNEQALRDALKHLPPRAEPPPPSTTTVPAWFPHFDPPIAKLSPSGLDSQLARNAAKHFPPRADPPSSSTTTLPESGTWDLIAPPTVALPQPEIDAQALRDFLDTLPSPEPTLLPNGEIAADILAALAELIFETEFFEYESPDGTILIGNDEYSLPEDISALVDFVVPGIMLAALFEELDEVLYDVVMVDSDPDSTGNSSQ